MILVQIIEEVQAQIICGNHLINREIDVTCAADLMSDVLACDIEPNTLLVTSLANSQVIRTAEMVELSAIIFVRGKKPNQQMVEMAEDFGVPLLCTKENMFNTCGKLYKLGLNGCW
ncbi:hypothetical protein IMX26_06040 [Clostridium sp. 'deep sea']|uniref:DRTGG domain-containing protein n=1 Tax=Clostridium sp. 'deep sea' TaxID=2779445 RepID=UPI0018966B3C|nr:DRTGG domain-containing protein [Clostridium sp. 'deep sea']QOR36372.1 hypothetical protein IMX26_06040 [Clostridium sp. 'deep sea']